MRVPLTGAAAGRRLIVNADDFGLTQPITDGVIEAFERGILTSASLVATGEAFQRAAQYAARRSDLDSGIHLMIVHILCDLLEHRIAASLPEKREAQRRARTRVAEEMESVPIEVKAS